MYEESHSPLAFSHNSTLLASDLHDAIQLRSVETSECIRTIKIYGDPLSAVAFSHDSSLIASSDGSIIRLWRINTGERVYKSHAHRDHHIDHLSFTSDGLHLLTNVGALTKPHGEQIIRYDGYGFNRGYSWMTWNGNNLLWVPVEYRPYKQCSAVDKTTLAVGCISGRVWIMKFSGYPH
ncbi:soluble quino protein glucose/sorbosone dehydrogenase [Trichoderma compactum]